MTILAEVQIIYCAFLSGIYAISALFGIIYYKQILKYADDEKTKLLRIGGWFLILSMLTLSISIVATYYILTINARPPAHSAPSIFSLKFSFVTLIMIIVSAVKLNNKKIEPKNQKRLGLALPLYLCLASGYFAISGMLMIFSPPKPLYTAIAYSPRDFVSSYSWDYPTYSQAEARAIIECNARSQTKDCKNLIVAQDICMANSLGSVSHKQYTKLSLLRKRAIKDSITACSIDNGEACVMTAAVCAGDRPSDADLNKKN